MRISDWSSDVCSSDLHAPGFEGLTLKRPANSPESEKMHNDDYHLPGGNGDVARLIIRSLIPDALPPGDVFDVADKRMDYAVFDRSSNPTRIRQSRSEEHTSELQSLMSISYAGFCLKKKKKNTRK